MPKNTTPTIPKYDVKVHSIRPEGSCKATASVNVYGDFAVRGIKVMEGSKGLFVSMPSYKAGNGEYKDICFPCTREAKAEFDKSSRRRFIKHTQSLPSDTIDDEDSKERSSLILKFNTFSVDLDETEMGGRYGWVEQIMDVRIADRLRRLSLEDLELLTLLVIDGYTQTEIARLQACSQNAISKKYLRIKKYLK